MKNLRLTTKGVVALMASTLLLGGAIGGTMAWLTAESDSVTNTFTVGDIGNLTLTETDSDKIFEIIPSVDIDKDPTVAYQADSTDVPVFVFVEMKFDTNTDWSLVDGGTDVYKAGTVTADNSDNTYGLKFEIADGWTLLAGSSYVYYKELAEGTSIGEEDENGDFVGECFFKKDTNGNTIEVNENITKEALSATENNAYDKLGITFKAYAIQKANGNDTNDGEFTAAEAWATVNPTTTTP